MPHFVHGTVGRLGVTSSDGREVDPAGFSIREVPLPLMGLFAVRGGHMGAEVVGRIGGVWIARDEVRICGTAPTAEEVDKGTPTLSPGVYQCGMDLDQVTNELVNAATGGPVDGDELDAFFADRGRALELIDRVLLSRLIAVTVYAQGSSAQAVWPGVQVTVE